MKEQLELKHLAPYLPYGVKVIGFNTYTNKEMVCDLTDRNLWTHIENQSKPILHSLSTIDLKFFQDNIDESIEDFRINCEPGNNQFSVEVCDSILGWSAFSFEEYQLFFEHHVDVFGLIDKGLAISYEEAGL